MFFAVCHPVVFSLALSSFIVIVLFLPFFGVFLARLSHDPAAVGEEPAHTYSSKTCPYVFFEHSVVYVHFLFVSLPLFICVIVFKLLSFLPRIFCIPLLCWATRLGEALPQPLRLRRLPVQLRGTIGLLPCSQRKYQSYKYVPVQISCVECVCSRPSHFDTPLYASFGIVS